MAQLNVQGAGRYSSQLIELLGCDDIEPGSDPSYQDCKTLYSYHPLGRKMAKGPVDMAQSQERMITCPDSPEDRIVEAFKMQWQRDECNKHINNTRTLSRVYGIASVAVLIDGSDPKTPMDYWKLWDQTIAFNVLDPLNTAGSLVLNQNPNALDFMKYGAISIAGTPYARNRSCTVMNEEPIYIQYTGSAFGFVGRSIYQRALFPLKSYINTMIMNDMIATKAGVLVAMVEQPGSVIDNMMENVGAQKRQLLKEAQNYNVLQVGQNDKIESLNLQNIDGAGKFARTNIVTDIATSADMPAVWLLNETLTEGFGEGTEDAKQIARAVSRERMELQPLYNFFDLITMHRAWNPDFYAIIQKDFPEQYGKMEYKEAFTRWKNSFSAPWPNLLEEPDSEKIKTQDVVFKAALACVEIIMTIGNPNATIHALYFLSETINANKLLFPEPLELDYDELELFLEEKQEQQQQMAEAGQDALGKDTEPGSKTMEKADSDVMARVRRATSHYDDSVRALLADKVKQLPLKQRASV